MTTGGFHYAIYLDFSFSRALVDEKPLPGSNGRKWAANAIRPRRLAVGPLFGFSDRLSPREPFGWLNLG
jgi:hypothetical protein